ncbi:hypothetical protein JXJ21_05010 [candidate division KSB1 bacterium]|nr:hypothetical protein [candidate division KSB1 bacterium]
MALHTNAPKILDYQIDIIAKVLAAVWQRKPLIIALKRDEDGNPLLKKILRIIPEYRQLIVLGNIPKRFFYQSSTAKFIENESLSERADIVYDCYSEDGIGGAPLHVLGLDIQAEEFCSIFSKLKYGWLATTSLTPPQIASIFQIDIHHRIDVDHFSVIFPHGMPTDISLEQQILEKCIDKIPRVAAFIIQMKMSEARFIAKAFRAEIEKGQKINQAEAEEQFDIDAITFKRVIELLEAEFHINPMPYIESTSPAVTSMLKQLLRLNGVFAGVALDAQKTIGYERKQDSAPVLLKMLIPFIKSLQEFGDTGIWGERLSMVVNMNQNKRLFFSKEWYAPINQHLYFAFFLDSKLQITILMSELEKGLLTQDAVK